jgi:putative membrane protein
VDRDNDIGRLTGVKTPVVGKDSCMIAAERLALADPEEADANTIFASIKEYDDLLKKGFTSEVVIVSGLYERGVLADRKIRNEVATVLGGFRAQGAVLVSDGIEGEELVPILQNLVPIVSLRKIVIKHSKTVEESYAVLGRYLKMLLFDPRYARYALGIPGLIFIAAVIIDHFSPGSGPVIVTALVGLIFVIRGFDIDRKVESIGSLSASGYLRLFASLASVLIILGGITAGVIVFFGSSFPPCLVSAGFAKTSCELGREIGQNNGLIINYAPEVIGFFLQGSQLYIWIGLGVYVTTSIFFDILGPAPRHVLRDVVALVVLGLLFLPVSFFAQVLLQEQQTNILIGIILLALAMSFAIAAYLYNLRTRRRRPSEIIDTNQSPQDLNS